jgi:hypothetical protein
LLRIAEELERGIAPTAVANAGKFGVRAATLVSRIAEFDELVAAHGGTLHAPDWSDGGKAMAAPAGPS